MIQFKMELLATGHRTGLSPPADDEGRHKKVFFFNMIKFLQKLVLPTKKHIFFFFFKTKCKNAPGVAGAVLQTVTD